MAPTLGHEARSLVEACYTGLAAVSTEPYWRIAMLHYAVVFFVIALIAALFGFSGIAAGAAGIAQVLFVVFLVLAVLSFIVNMVRGR